MANSNWFDGTGADRFGIHRVAVSIFGNDITYHPPDGSPDQILRGTLQHQGERLDELVETHAAVDTEQTVELRRASGYRESQFPRRAGKGDYGTVSVAGRTYAIRAVRSDQTFVYLDLDTGRDHS